MQLPIITYLNKRKKLAGHILVGVLLVILFRLDAFSYIEYRIEDLVYQRPRSVSNPNIFVFGIDEKSLDKLGRFQQWGRDIMADAINAFNKDEDYKPAVIAIDILYVGESDDKEADEKLAKAAADGGNVVVASYAVFGYDRENPSLETVVTGYETPYPALLESASHGLTNATFDDDGVIRRARLRTRYQDEEIYSFPYVVYDKYAEGVPEELLNADDMVYITYSEKPGGYYGTSGVGLSFSDILEEDFEPEYFADSIVFIGPYATGLMDSYYTPVSHQTPMYGVEIHANVLQMLMENNIKHRVSPNVSLMFCYLSLSPEQYCL